MARAASKRKHLIGARGCRALESMTVLAGSMVADRHGAAAVADNLYLIQKQEAERDTL